MTTAQFVETSVTVNNNSPIQDYVHPDDQTQPFEIVYSLIHNIFTNQLTEYHPAIVNMYIEPQGHHAWPWPAMFSEIKF